MGDKEMVNFFNPQFKYRHKLGIAQIRHEEDLRKKRKLSDA